MVKVCGRTEGRDNKWYKLSAYGNILWYPGSALLNHYSTLIRFSAVWIASVAGNSHKLI